MQTAVKALYQASHPFAGSGPGQLSFSAGDLLLVQPERQHGGWIWACHNYSKSHSGWVPLSYLTSKETTGIEANTSPFISFHSNSITSASTSTNIFDDTYNSDTNGFEEPIMGGEWISNKDIPIAVGDASDYNVAHTPGNNSQGHTGGRLGSGVKGGVKGIGSGVKVIGSGLKHAGKKTGETICSGTKKAASTCRNSVTEAKYRIDDMKQQRQKQSRESSHNGPQTVQFGFRCLYVQPKVGLFFPKKINPFYEISTQLSPPGEASGKAWQTVYRSENIDMEINPSWKVANIPFDRITAGNHPILFKLFNEGKNGKHELIGEFETSVQGLLELYSSKTNNNASESIIFTVEKRGGKGRIQLTSAAIFDGKITSIVDTAATSSKPRTPGEQMKINAANGAARGALVGGTVGFVLSGGNVSAATRSATVHGAYGGAYGAASGWKPFGK